MARFSIAHDGAAQERARRGAAGFLASQIAFAQETAFAQNGEDYLLAIYRFNGEPHLATLDVEHRERRISLREYWLHRSDTRAGFFLSKACVMLGSSTSAILWILIHFDRQLLLCDGFKGSIGGRGRFCSFANTNSARWLTSTETFFTDWRVLNAVLG